MARFTCRNYRLVTLLLKGSWLSAQRLLLLFAAGVALLWGCAPRSQPGAQRDSPDGKALYAVNCASCHGEDGRNDRQGANRAMRLKKANALSDKEWETLVQNGRGEMPAFHNRLSLQEIHALREYVHRLTNQ